MKSLTELLADNIAKSQTSKSETFDCTITSISPWKPTSTGLERSFITTKDHGNFFTLKSAIRNPISSYGAGVPAKIVIIPQSYKDKNGNDVEGLRVAGVTLELIDPIRQAELQSMKVAMF